MLYNTISNQKGNTTMDKLNAAIMEAYEGYQTALDYVKGWKKEAPADA